MPRPNRSGGAIGYLSPTLKVRGRELSAIFIGEQAGLCALAWWRVERSIFRLDSSYGGSLRFLRGQKRGWAAHYHRADQEIIGIWSEVLLKSFAGFALLAIGSDSDICQFLHCSDLTSPRPARSLRMAW